MVDGRVLERLNEFIWNARCAKFGDDSKSSSPNVIGKDSIGVFSDSGSCNLADSSRLRLVDRGFGVIHLVEFALRGAGFEVTRARPTCDEEQEHCRAILVRLNSRDVDDTLRKFDSATGLLNDARRDCVLRDMAIDAANVILDGFGNKQREFSEFDVFGTIDARTQRRLLSEIGLQLGEQFGVKIDLQSDVEHKIRSVSGRVVDLIVEQVEEANRTVRPLPRFDTEMVNMVCRNIGTRLDELRRSRKEERQGVAPAWFR